MLEKPIVWEVFAPIVRVDFGNFRRGKNGLPERFYVVTSFLWTDRLARSIGDSNPTGGRTLKEAIFEGRTDFDPIGSIITNTNELGALGLGTFVPRILVDDGSRNAQRFFNAMTRKFCCTSARLSLALGCLLCALRLLLSGLLFRGSWITFVLDAHVLSSALISIYAGGSKVPIGERVVAQRARPLS